MKFLKGLGYGLLTLFALLCALILLCAARPDVTQRLSGFLYGRGGDTEGTVQIDSGDQDVAMAQGMDTTGINPPFSEEPSYQEPQNEEQEIPETVAGKNGFEPVKNNEETVKKEEGKSLKDTLGFGETGEGLEFDAGMYPYYAMLDEPSKAVYRQIYANSQAENDKFTPVQQISAKQLKNAFTAVTCDQPQLFWLDTAYGAKFLSPAECVEIDLQFNSTATHLERSRELFEAAANDIIAQAEGLPGDYEKERYIHNALIDKLSYRLSAPLNQSAYSAVVGEQTVCAGYARAMQYLLQQLNIPCYYCMGFAGESHAWNIVKLSDGYYNADVTWADTEPMTYDYFNKSDADYMPTHRRTDLSIYLPACEGSAFSNLEENPEGNPKENPGGEEMPASLMTAGNPSAEGTDMPANAAPVQMRSLADLGFSEEDVITDLTGYNENCKQQLLDRGAGSYTIQNVISGTDLYDEIYQEYAGKTFREAFANEVIDTLQAKSISIRAQGEQLRDGYILLSHRISMN